MNPATLLASAALFLFGAAEAAAKCLPIAGTQPRMIPAAATEAALPEEGSVRLTFLGHSSFHIETAQGVSAVTDFNGYLVPEELPDIVTMNNAHDTHYSDYIDPEIGVALRGWNDKTGIALHDVTVKDLRVWNLPTNVRDWGGTRYNGNSIFVFEAADLCIGHLGHLHHLLTDEHLGELGLIDVLLAPADGIWTMGHERMVQVIAQIRPSVVIPMHYFNAETLGRFLGLMEPRYSVVVSETPTVTFSRLNLPFNKVLVLPGG